MTLRANLAAAARRAWVGISRATLVKADDSKKWQEITVRAELKRTFRAVEVAHPYGFTAVGKPPADNETSEAAEIVIVFPDGDMSHPIALVVGDRRYRLKNLAEGEVALYDDQGQKVHLKRDELHVYSSKPVLVESDEKATIKAPIVVIDSADIRLGGEDATRPVSAIGTVTSDGAEDVSNPLSTVKGK